MLRNYQTEEKFLNIQSHVYFTALITHPFIYIYLFIYSVYAMLYTLVLFPAIAQIFHAATCFGHHRVATIYKCIGSVPSNWNVNGIHEYVG